MNHPPKTMIGTKRCRNCGAEIGFTNQKAFLNSLKKGGTLCRQCTGAVRKTPAHTQYPAAQQGICRCGEVGTRDTELTTHRKDA